MKHRTSEVTQVWAEEEKNYGCGWFCSSWKALENGKMIVWSWKSKSEGSLWDLRGAMSYALLSSKPYEKSIRNWGSDSQLCQWDMGLSGITLICRPGCVFIISPWTSLIGPKLHAFLSWQNRAWLSASALYRRGLVSITSLRFGEERRCPGYCESLLRGRGSPQQQALEVRRHSRDFTKGSFAKVWTALQLPTRSCIQEPEAGKF